MKQTRNIIHYCLACQVSLMSWSAYLILGHSIEPMQRKEAVEFVLLISLLCRSPFFFTNIVVFLMDCFLTDALRYKLYDLHLTV